MNSPLAQSENAQTGAAICPHLGGPKDQDIYYQYPSNWNRCYRPETSQRVSLLQQEEHCLCDRFESCKVYRPEWDGVFPSEWIRLPEHSESGRRARWTRRQLIILSVFLLIAAGTLAAAVLGFLTPAKIAQDVVSVFDEDSGSTASSLPTVTVIAPAASPTPEPATALPTATAIPLPTMTPQPTAELPPTATPFPTPGPGFGTPFGPDAGYVIHIVVEGESFTLIGRRYGASAEAVEAVNPNEYGTSLWVGQPIVVPVGVTDAADLPVFRIVFTTQSVSLAAFAAENGADAEQIRFYNALGESDIVPSGRWMIIPLVDNN